MANLCDDPRATPTHRSGYMDWTVEKGRRMLWVFRYADGSSRVVSNPKAGFILTERMMKAGLIKGTLADALKASVRRLEMERVRNAH